MFVFRQTDMLAVTNPPTFLCAIDAGGFDGSTSAGFGGDPNGGGATIDGAPGGTDNNNGDTTNNNSGDTTNNNSGDTTNNSTSTNAGVSFGSPAVAQVAAATIAVGIAATSITMGTAPVVATAAFVGAVITLGVAGVNMEKEGMSFGGQAVLDASQYNGMVTATEEIGNTLGIDEARGQNTQVQFQEIINTMQASPLQQVHDLVPVLAGSYTTAVQDYFQQRAYANAHIVATNNQLLASAHANGESDLGISILTKIITDQQHILGIR